ncbi:MAG: hypothetical protein KC492_20990 [Myxococcales bacterium]|nr:hypothetical protein [Myxococcales bacterium]
MQLPREIDPHKGLGPLRFGLTRRATQSLLGDPDRIDDSSVPDWHLWAYDYYGLEAVFAADANWRLVQLDTHDAQYLVARQSVVGIPWHRFLAIIPRLGLGDSDHQLVAPGLHAVWFPERDVSVWFNDGVASNLAWSAQIDASDSYAFPQLSGAA